MLCLFSSKHVYCWTDTTKQMFTAEETQQMNVDIQMLSLLSSKHWNVDVPNIYCRTDTLMNVDIQMFTVNRHNKWMSTFKCLLLESKHRNVDVPNVYCQHNKRIHILCLSSSKHLERHDIHLLRLFSCKHLERNKWHSCLLLKQWMSTSNVSAVKHLVPNVSSTHHEVVSVYCSKHECRRSKCLLSGQQECRRHVYCWSRHNKWMSTFKCLLSRQTFGRSTFMFTAVDTTNECRLKCLLSSKHLERRHSFVVSVQQ